MYVITDFLRMLSSWIDFGLYSLAGFIYRVFCAISDTSILSTNDIKIFINRIYIVIGVFMLFKVGIAMLKYLVNPDQLTDNKTGYGKLIWNITIALILMVSVPTIYTYAMKAQSAIIDSKIIPKVILGVTVGETYDKTDAGDQMIFTTLSAFMMPNYLVTDKENGTYLALQDSNVRTCFHTNSDGTVMDTGSYNGIFEVKDGVVTGFSKENKCEEAMDYMLDKDDPNKNLYVKAVNESNIQMLLDVAVDAKLSEDNIQAKAGRDGNGSFKLYFLKYMWGISWLVGAFLCFIFVSFCIDVAIRSIKLAFLVIISPIPILSMVNPDRGAKGMLSEWWKITWVTYLDIFLRIASIYFVIYIIQNVDLTSQVAGKYGPIVSAFTTVFIIIGALLFAKQLPELVSKLIPGMDSVVKGGMNPLKKLGEAANVASRAPLVGKGITGLSNRLATQHALNRANRRMENAKRKDKERDFRNKLNQIKNSQTKTPEQRQKEMDELKEQHRQEMATFDRESGEHLRAQRELAREEAKYAGQQAAAGVSIFGGESKPITAAGAAVAKINKESADKVHKMQMGSLQQRQAEANLAKVEDQAKAERNAEIEQKEKQIVDVQRQAEVERRMKDPKYKNMTDAERKEARATVEREVQEMEASKLREQVVAQKVQEKMAQGMTEAEAKTAATQEVAAMSQKDIESKGNASKIYSNIEGEVAAKKAEARGASKQEIEAERAEAMKTSREKAEDKVVGSLSDKMDEVAERKGIIYNSSEYAEQVKITREAKNRRNAIQSEYEKAARQQQYEGKVTTADGRELVGQAAIDYVDKLRVDYTKASGDYDFMSKELDSLGEKYPDDAATRKGYEAAKDYQDKKKKVTKYASKSSVTSNNEREGAQYTVEELIGEDTVVNRLRRADTQFATSAPEFETKKIELESKAQILQAQIRDNEIAGNASEVARLRNELNVNTVELGRVNTSIASAGIARTNAINGLHSESTAIENKLRQLETEYQQLEEQSNVIITSGATDTVSSNTVSARREEIERQMNLLNNRTEQINAELTKLGVSETTQFDPNPTVADIRLSGVGGFDKIGTPIRMEIDNIVNQLEVDVQKINNVSLSNEERTKAKLAVESALKKYSDEREKVGTNIHSGMSEQESQQYETELNNRISQIIYELQSNQNNGNNS